MEGDFIKINEWLTPLSWVYGLGVWVRNQLFELNILKSRAFDIPVISVGNITVGGSGKTPHVEYLIRLLKEHCKVAVLSRGYKRKSRGYQIADEDSTMRQIGDEPLQMHLKFPDIYVAVDTKRCNGIDRLTSDDATNDTDVVLLDDAFQHRYVKPGINILLVDYHRLIMYDKLLPAGRLREPVTAKRRADVVIVTKCPSDLNPINYRVLIKATDLYPYQDLFFTTLEYDTIYPLFGENKTTPELKDKNILLLTGIASPEQMIHDLEPQVKSISPLSFPDHHNFKGKDVRRINQSFESMDGPKMIITTEKDATRLKACEGLSDKVKENIYILPVKVRFMLDQEDKFNEKIISYVRKNSRNSILAKGKNDRKARDSNHSGNRPRTISFRDI
jgi:tetraacyldisaccharide 4'-kinase